MLLKMNKVLFIQKNKLLNLNLFLNQQQNLYLKLNQKLVVLKVKHLLQLLQLKVILFKQIKKHLLNVHQDSLIMHKRKVRMNKILCLLMRQEMKKRLMKMVLNKKLHLYPYLVLYQDLFQKLDHKFLVKVFLEVKLKVKWYLNLFQQALVQKVLNLSLKVFQQVHL